MAVEVGEQAPDFELNDQHGTPVRLSSLRGAKNVVLVFYPLAFSGVCTSELCAIRDEFRDVKRDDVEVLTVSVDSTFTHRAWSDSEHFEFGLLSDFWPHGRTVLVVQLKVGRLLAHLYRHAWSFRWIRACAGISRSPPKSATWPVMASHGPFGKR
jgi:peroxiredoxin